MRFLLTLSALILAAPLWGGDLVFTKDVAPLLYQHCVVCHRPNDVAPMSLLTYKEARPWVSSIRQAVLMRTMPPWHADPHHGDFSNSTRLSDAEIATIIAWVKGGAKEGDPKDLPEPPVFPEGWHIRPDAVLPIPNEHPVSATTSDEYAYIYVPTNFTEDKWVKIAEVLPGDRRIVHHATVSVVPGDRVSKDQLGKVRRGKDSKYRYSTGNVTHIRPEVPVLDDGCSSPEGGALPGSKPSPVNFLSIFLPGHIPEVRPDGYAIKIPAGSVLQFQIHYSNRTGKDLTDRTSIGLVFAKEPVTHRIMQYEIWNDMFAIPAGAPNHRVTSCYTLDRDVTALAYTGHMHYRGKSFQTEAVFPDGKKEILFSVPRYDFRWQETYMLRDPKLLPKGTRLVTTAHFDNSPNNPLNPDPSKTIRWGEPSDEEMMGFWLAFTEPKASTEKQLSAVQSTQ